MITPLLLACPIDAITAVGVDKNNAQGQNTTKTVTARLIESCKLKFKNLVITKVKIAIKSAVGTSFTASLSITVCIGVCSFSALSTRSINFCKEEFSTCFAIISMLSKQFMLPQKTSSPTVLSIGRLSLVRMDWSIEVKPSFMIPSTGML